MTARWLRPDFPFELDVTPQEHVLIKAALEQVVKPKRKWKGEAETELIPLLMKEDFTDGWAGHKPDYKGDYQMCCPSCHSIDLEETQGLAYGGGFGTYWTCNTEGCEWWFKELAPMAEPTCVECGGSSAVFASDMKMYCKACFKVMLKYGKWPGCMACDDLACKESLEADGNPDPLCAECYKEAIINLPDGYGEG